MKQINDVIKGNHYGEDIRCFYRIFMKNTSEVCNSRLQATLVLLELANKV